MEIVYSDRSLSHGMHAHGSYEMLYIEEGEILLSIRGREYAAGPGDLVFLNQLEEHATRLCRAPYRRFYLLIPPYQFKAFHDDVHLLSVFRLHGGEFPYVLHTGGEKERFREYFHLLYQIAGEENAYREARMEAMVFLILTQAQALNPDMFANIREGSFLPIQEIQEQLEQDFSQAFSLQALAESFHVSPGCLSAHFRRYVGMSPMQYVTENRLAHGKRLLLQSDLSVHQIALECGYGDLSNFSRRFRQRFSMTPLEFRRQYRDRKE